MSIMERVSNPCLGVTFHLEKSFSFHFIPRISVVYNILSAWHDDSKWSKWDFYALLFAPKFLYVSNELIYTNIHQYDNACAKMLSIL